MDLLLRAGVFMQTVLNGRWAGPPGSPGAIETSFEWVLAGATNGKPGFNGDVCYFSMVCDVKRRRSYCRRDSKGDPHMITTHVGNGIIKTGGFRLRNTSRPAVGLTGAPCSL